MNKYLLMQKMHEHHDTQANLAKVLGISPTRLNHKINETRNAQFNADEIVVIINRYGLTQSEVMAIFFA